MMNVFIDQYGNMFIFPSVDTSDGLKILRFLTIVSGRKLKLVSYVISNLGSKVKNSKYFSKYLGKTKKIKEKW